MKYTISPYVQFHIALKHVVKNKWYRKQGELSKRAGITESFLSGILKNKKRASHDTQVSLSEAAGFSYENFLALGRKIHQGDDINYLVDEIKSPGQEYDLHGGWKPREIKVSMEVKKVLDILESDSIYKIALLANINALHDAMKDKNKVRDLEDKVEGLKIDFENLLERTMALEGNNKSKK